VDKGVNATPNHGILRAAFGRNQIIYHEGHEGREWKKTNQEAIGSRCGMHLAV